MGGYFYGWYLKCQSDTQTLAVIPAIHRSGRKRAASVQIITEDGAWTIPFRAEAYRRRWGEISIGKNRFGRRGIQLSIHTPQVYVKGKISFGPLFPLKYSIMGPFALVPFLECRHRVMSMWHLVRGKVNINGQRYSFRDGWGYWEGDSGCSFPREYIWTQCSFGGGSLMLSVADIPMAGFHFNGVICVVYWQGREYRLATYLGARAVHIRDGAVRIVQGDLELEAHLLERSGCPLKAPAEGDMVRTIRESAACKAFYRFRKDGHTLFAYKTDRASFEYEYPT